jgi:acetylornithine deacetylase/succinyl-diaminopimelate desuccinylase-like protein
LGDLRGMRAAVDHLQPTLGACIVIEGMGLGRIVHQALGSQRYRISVHAPGGHSWSAFGAASAIHVLVQLAAGLTQLEAPRRPRTTFNIGRISGGTSINTIAQHATLELDLRSESGESLEEIVAQSLEIVARYQSPEWRARGVIVSAQLIGDRPSGQISRKHPLVQAAMQVLTSFGLDFDSSMALSSTDANVPLSRNIPAVCIGLSDGGNAHRLDEWINPKFMGQGMQQLLALTWWAAMWLAGEVK